MNFTLKTKSLILFFTLLLCGTVHAQNNSIAALEEKIQAAEDDKDYKTVARLSEKILLSKPKNTY